MMHPKQRGRGWAHGGLRSPWIHAAVTQAGVHGSRSVTAKRKKGRPTPGKCLFAPRTNSPFAAPQGLGGPVGHLTPTFSVEGKGRASESG